MFGSGAVPAVALLILLFMVPESPRWLVKVGRFEKLRKCWPKSAVLSMHTITLSNDTLSLQCRLQGGRAPLYNSYDGATVTLSSTTDILMAYQLTIFQ